MAFNIKMLPIRQNKNYISKKISHKNILPLPTINEHIQIAFDDYFKKELKSKQPKFASLYTVTF